MILNEHLELKGKHAMLSPSQYSWINYTKEQMQDKVAAYNRVTLGTEIHEYACSQIQLNIRQTSAKNIISGIKTYIYRKYYNPDTNNVSKYGKRLITDLKYMPSEVFETVKAYVNDAIGFRMSPEVVLVYSPIIFGTTDSLSFRDNTLRIHDLKTGSTPAHIEQLAVYAALFCLEYKADPRLITIELRIYQNNEATIVNPESDYILQLMQIIKDHDQTAREMTEEEWK